MTLLAALAALSLAAWLRLVFAHGRFWLCDQLLDERAPAPARWPCVVAVVPARDEAGLLPETLRSLLHAGRGLGLLLVPAFVCFFQKLYPFPSTPRGATGASKARSGRGAQARDGARPAH